MGFMYQVSVYVAGYLLLIFVAICLACGLYFLAELAEEHTRLARKLIGFSIVLVRAWLHMRTTSTRLVTLIHRCNVSGSGIAHTLLRHRAGAATGLEPLACIATVLPIGLLSPLERARSAGGAGRRLRDALGLRLALPILPVPQSALAILPRILCIDGRLALRVDYSFHRALPSSVARVVLFRADG